MVLRTRYPKTSATHACRKLTPKPNYLINSSPDKWQVVWKVAEFAKQQAEDLQRGLARECGSDSAATDCARVLRLPGVYNHLLGIRLTQVTTTGRIRCDGRVPAKPDRVGGKVFHGGGLPGLFGAATVARRFSMPTLPGCKVVAG